MAERRKYTDEDRANALAALAVNGGNVLKTAQELGIPRKTLTGWSEAIGDVRPDAPGVAEPNRHKRQAIGERLEAIIHLLLDALPSKIESASLAQLSTSFGIAFDKIQLLKGLPTGITGNAVKLTEQERVLGIRGLFTGVSPASPSMAEADPGPLPERNGHGSGPNLDRPGEDHGTGRVSA